VVGSNPIARQTLALPINVVTTLAVKVGTVEHARQYKEQVTQSVEIVPWFSTYWLYRAQGHDSTFSAPGHGTAYMGQRSAACACGQYEFLQTRQSLVVVGKRLI
jgi:hypothetical protein